MNEFRTLRSDEIDVRVSTINEKGLTLLLYKDARVDQNILDESFGMFGWKRSHRLIGDRLYCTVEVRDKDTGEWVSKEDVGTESYTEKEKGQASDAFKRACFNWGIGRELYTAPFIWIGAEHYNVKSNNAGKPTTYDRFKVSEIGYDGKTINRLVIVNTSKKNAIVFSMGDEADAKIPENVVTGLKVAASKREAPESIILDIFGVKTLQDILVSEYNQKKSEIMKRLDEWVDENAGKAS